MPVLSPDDARLLRDDLLEITWSDGKRLYYPTDLLRSECPCAHCAPTLPTEPRKGREHYFNVTLTGLEQIGTYAFKIDFSDHHDQGIYTWQRLLSIGIPEESLPQKPSIPSPFEV